MDGGMEGGREGGREEGGRRKGGRERERERGGQREGREGGAWEIDMYSKPVFKGHHTIREKCPYMTGVPLSYVP